MSRPTALLIPGLNGSPLLLEAAARRFLPGMELELFNHCQDAAEDGVPGLAERAWEQVAELPAERPLYVVGESFGGPVALALARAHQERIAGLILISTFGRYPDLHAGPRRMGMALWDRLGLRFGAAVLGCARPFELPGQLGLRFPPGVARDLLALPHPYGAGYREKCRLALEVDAESWAREIELPVLVLVPRWDLAVPPEAGLSLAAALPRATLHRVPGGHLFYLVHPELVANLVDDWRRAEVESLRPSSSRAGGIVRPHLNARKQR